MAPRTFLVTVVLLLLTLGGVAYLSVRGEPEVIETNLDQLPMEINGFRAKEDAFPDYIYEILNGDQHVYRHYGKAGGGIVDLYIGYYGTAKGGRSSHNPYSCLPGAGWAIIETGKVDVDSAKYPDGVTVNYILARKGGVNNLVFHWYQAAGGKVLSSGIQQNVQRFLGRVFKNRNDGAYVQVSRFADEQDIPNAKNVVKDFSRKILELLPGFWPVEG